VKEKCDLAVAWTSFEVRDLSSQQCRINSPDLVDSRPYVFASASAFRQLNHINVLPVAPLPWLNRRRLTGLKRSRTRYSRDRCGISSGMSKSVEESHRRMLRARDTMDRTYARPLDIAALAGIACVSQAHFIRTFRATFAETPHRYLQRRRVERAMFLLRSTDRSVTEICLDVGFASLGTFSRTFKEIIGEPPMAYRKRGAVAVSVPTCFLMAWTRPSSFGEAKAVLAR
jgi:AraC-like DNA-binding protein